MATISRGYSYSSTEQVTADKLHSLVDSATISGITNADIAAGAAIVDTKLAQITTASKTHGSSLTGLESIAAGAGMVPPANLGSASSSSTGTATATTYLTQDGQWRHIGLKSLPAGSIVQVVNVMSSSVATGSTTMPSDDSIPQKTEGNEYMTLAITPTSATNKLRIDVIANFANSVYYVTTTALFQDDTENALAAVAKSPGINNTIEQACLTHYMEAGTTSSTTFKVRIGQTGSSTTTFNGSGGSRLYGGVIASSITITEIKV